MEITLINTPVKQLRQLDVVVPIIAGQYVFKSPNMVIIPDTITLSPTQITSIQNFQFDPCVAHGNYDPTKMNKKVKEFDQLNSMIQPLVGQSPPDIATYDFVSKYGGLNPSGIILPLAAWREEPVAYAEFKTSPCYAP